MVRLGWKIQNTIVDAGLVTGLISRLDYIVHS